jgi:hypothetical protein
MIIRSFWVVAAKTEQNGWIELFDPSIFVLEKVVFVIKQWLDGHKNLN